MVVRASLCYCYAYPSLRRGDLWSSALRIVIVVHARHLVGDAHPMHSAPRSVTAAFIRYSVGASLAPPALRPVTALAFLRATFGRPYKVHRTFTDFMY